MKIPNKIYLEVLPHSKSKEVYKDVLKIKRTFEDDVEYTRTDAFIEKVVKWIESTFSMDYNESERDSFIKDFKNYMKGE